MSFGAGPSLGERCFCAKLANMTRMGTHRFVQLDVFTEQPFAGNALAVFPDGSGIPEHEMLRIAREMNLSETVFVLQPKPAENKSPKALRRLRIFTPTRELPFAGHPVVGTWNLLAREDVVPKPDSGTGWTRIYQELGIGTLPVDIEFEDGRIVQVVMTQGKAEFGTVLEDAHEQADLIRSLGLAPEHLDENLPIQVVSTGMKFLLVPVRALADLRNCRINAALLTEIYRRHGATGCYAFSQETIEVGESRANARMFAPDDNIPEDPATGSAGGALGAYLVYHKALPDKGDNGVFKFVIEQGDFINRASRLNVEVKGTAGAIEEVRVGGPSVVVARGEIEF
jgi:trans-2,3-dihydro-3-hydroxyanthranilate isomerase